MQGVPTDLPHRSHMQLTSSPYTFSDKCVPSIFMTGLQYLKATIDGPYAQHTAWNNLSLESFIGAVNHSITAREFILCMAWSNDMIKS
jgi:hypothetical protein